MAEQHGAFDEFWQRYPVKRDKGHARIAFAAALKKTTLAALLQALETQIASRAQARSWVPEWPYPATWLRGERWTDEPFHAPPPGGGQRATTLQRERTDEMKRLIHTEGLTIEEAAKRVGYH